MELDVKCKNIKLLKANIEIRCVLGFCDEFLDTIPKAQNHEEKKVSWALLKLKALIWQKILKLIEKTGDIGRVHFQSTYLIKIFNPNRLKKKHKIQQKENNPFKMGKKSK